MEKCVKEDMMDPVDPEDYAVHHDHSYMCMEKPCMCKLHKIFIIIFVCIGTIEEKLTHFNVLLNLKI